jgi:hypothetical protein
MAKLTTSLVGRRIQVRMGYSQEQFDADTPQGEHIRGLATDAERDRATHEPWRYFWLHGGIVTGVWTDDGASKCSVLFECGRVVDLFCSHITVLPEDD